MIKLLKKTDRTLLEMYTGMLLFGIVCQISGIFLVKDRLRYTASLWFGVLFAAVACVHMAKTLDRALPDSDRARGIIARGYAFRYIMVIVIFLIISVTEVLDTLIVFLGYMSLKVTAYLQPFTHKFYNWLFHETDPVPEALPEEAEEGSGDVSREGADLPG